METNHLKSHTEQSQALDDWSARGYPNTNDHFTHPKSPADKSFDISATSKALLSEDDRSRKPSFSRSPQPKASNIFMPLVDWQAEVVSENIALAGIVRTPKIPQEFNIPTTKVTRAQWNWNKLKRIYHALKVEGTLKLFIAEKERKVHRGTTIKELVVYQSYWARFKLFYIDPRTRSMTIWRFIFEVGVVYYTLVFPCQLAFGTNRTQLDPLNVITDIVDVHFFTDMIMTFFVALRQPDGTLITHKSTIVKSYLKGLFFIDLIGILPYELFLPHLSFLKLLRIIHLGRFFGHMNQFADLIVPYFVQGLAIIKIADFIGSLITSLLVLGLTFHYLACMWVLLGKKESANEMTWFDDITFKYEIEGEAIVDGKTSIYTSSLEHIAQTLTTVGYGTFYGFTARELLFSIFVLLFGIIVFTFVFEKTKSILASYNEADRRQKLQIKKLDAWLRKLDWAVIDYKDMVNEPLLEKIKTILTYRIDESWQKLFTNNEQFKKLDNESGRMILDLAMNKFKKKFDIIFRDISSEFVYKILAQSDSRLFMPGEVIISRGKRPKGLFLILRGSILLAGPSEEKYFTRLGSNSFFGEICIASERRSPIYYIAESEVNCLFIRKEIIEELRGKFPIDIQKLKALAFFRYKHFLYQKHHHQQQEINGSPKRTNNEDISDSSLQVLQTYDVDKQIDLISPPEPYSVDQNTEIHLLASPEINEKDQVFKDFDTNKSPEKNLQRHKTEDPGLIPLLKPSRKKNKKKTTIISKAVDKLLTLDESDIELAQNSSESELGDYFDAESEESQQDINQEEIRDYENEKEEDDPDHLNSSEIYPLEVNSVFSDILKSDNYLEYLEERVVFIQDRLKKLNQKFNLELQYTLRRQQAINRKLIVAGMAGGPFALIKR